MFDKSTLQTIREAHVAAIDAAMRDAQRNCAEFGSFPEHLLAASVWLSWQGLAALPSTGERYFNWPLTKVRRYMRRLSTPALFEMVEAGRRAIFDGSADQAPLFRTPAASVDGEPVSALEAAKLRELGPRRKLGLRWAA